MQTVCPSCDEELLEILPASVEDPHVRCAGCGEGFYLIPESQTIPALTDAFSMTFDESTMFEESL